MSQKQDRKSGELEVEQDPGVPRAWHPRRHLAGSSLIEYDDGDDLESMNSNLGDVESETLRYPALSDWIQ